MSVTSVLSRRLLPEQVVPIVGRGLRVNRGDAVEPGRPLGGVTPGRPATGRATGPMAGGPVADIPPADHGRRGPWFDAPARGPGSGHFDGPGQFDGPGYGARLAAPANDGSGSNTPGPDLPAHPSVEPRRRGDVGLRHDNSPARLDYRANKHESAYYG